MNDDDLFWDRIEEMPLIEAEQELVLRREKNNLTIAMLKREQETAWPQKEKDKIGVEMFQVMAQMTKINERLKYIRKLQDTIRWKNAVKALYGQEAVEQCLIWIEQNQLEK